MKKILISGGTGLIGTELTNLLLSRGYQVDHLSRSSGEKNGVKTWQWDYKKKQIDLGAIKDVYGIVHLAGAGIADKRWTDARKQVIIESRVETAELMFEALIKSAVKPVVFISASGINYYGSVTTDKVFVESDPPSASFIGECCRKWEAAADLFAPICRVVKLRTGVVLSPQGGALEKIAQPIKYGFGAALGSGEQYMPYIHIEDLAQMYLKAIENDAIQGSYNATNGDHLTNAQLTKEIASALKKPLWLPNVPGFAMKLALGELSEILLEGSRASADKIKAVGFTFKHPDIQNALRAIYNMG